MLRLIFYKNCILNNKYQNVISPRFIQPNISFLTEYLNGLNKITIDLNDVYYENNGEIIFEDNLLDTPYNYNYMLAIQYEGSSELFKRYCFIKKISIKHGCAYVEYEEDIFSSYLNDVVNSHDCELVNSRLCNYIQNDGLFNYRKLVVEYDGNNNLDYERITTDECYIFVELQIYKLVSGSSSTFSNNRESMIVKLFKTEYKSQIDKYLVSDTFLKQDVDNIIKALIKYISSTDTHIGAINPYSASSDDLYYYDIGHIYILPDLFDFSNIVETLNNTLEKANNKSVKNPRVLFLWNYCNMSNCFIYTLPDLSPEHSILRVTTTYICNRISFH